MDYNEMDAILTTLLSDYLDVRAETTTPLYELLKGKPQGYRPRVTYVRDGRALSSYDIHDTYETPEQALGAGFRIDFFTPFIYSGAQAAQRYSR